MISACPKARLEEMAMRDQRRRRDQTVTAVRGSVGDVFQQVSGAWEVSPLVTWDHAATWMQASPSQIGVMWAAAGWKGKRC